MFTSQHARSTSSSTCMSKEQKSTSHAMLYRELTDTNVDEFLTGLRTNASRPSGSRPLPASRFNRSVKHGPGTMESDRPAIQQSNSMPVMLSEQLQRRSSKTKMRESMLGRPLVQEPESGHVVKRVPSYLENGTRWMERQEVKSLRQALNDMDLADEHRVHKAAQDEAAELVWKHQNPSAVYKNPDVHRDYKSHLRKGSYQRSNQDAVPIVASRVEVLRRVSDEEKQKTVTATQDRKSSDGSTSAKPSTNPASERRVSGKSYGDLADVVRKDIAESRRRVSSGTRRLLSGEKKRFMHPDDKIWEDSEVAAKPFTSIPELRPTPSYMRKNPFARVRMQQPERAQSEPLLRQGNTITTKHDSIEIQRNPPSQSRDAGYTRSQQQSPAPQAEEKELRSEDIRAATSRLRRDRSPNLPQPTLVSDKPGRPIVSFAKPEIVLVEEQQRDRDQLRASPSMTDRPASSSSLMERPSSSATTIVNTSSWSSRIPVLSLPRQDTIPSYDSPAANTPAIPTIAFPDNTPAMPVMAFPDNARAIPMIALPEGTSAIPSIVLPDDDNPGVPTISLPEECPSNETIIPSIILPAEPSFTNIAPQARVATRPLPSRRPKSTPHYSPSMQSSGTLCAHCALPIAGRILSAAGARFHPGCFRCHECNTNLELVAFYPEPEQRRAERVDRIRAGIEEGDETLQFYCHLDFHESFSPRCKSCKTPIEGEIIVACGAEWHAGHFFCAQCGDPFDSRTPFVEKDGYAWCVDCHTNRYSSKCRKCKKPVIDVVVKALGADWHSKCFRCQVCRSARGYDCANRMFRNVMETLVMADTSSGERHKIRFV